MKHDDQLDHRRSIIHGAFRRGNMERTSCQKIWEMNRSMTLRSGFASKLRNGRKITTSIGKVALILYFPIFIAELAIFVFAPNEMMGWGEKPALRPDPVFGWRLIESKTTRLRWQGYDYVVTSNSLGFPGPEHPTDKPPHVYRIMTVGGGFTSAEGVDTDQSWPRILEFILNRRGARRSAEVLNFAVTGYGPGQYAAVVEKFAPVYRPDAIIVTLIPNDLRKVMIPFSQRVKEIGFDRPNPNGLFAVLSCQHFLRSARRFALASYYEILTRRPNPMGYSLGQIWAFERCQRGYVEEAEIALEKRLIFMRTIAVKLQSHLVLLLVPASVQVCSPEQLHYFPGHINLSDSARFNLNQPQAHMAESATKLGIEYYDLREVFDPSQDECYYQPKNMHWTKEGHQAVAEFVARLLKIKMGAGDPVLAAGRVKVAPPM